MKLFRFSLALFVALLFSLSGCDDAAPVSSNEEDCWQWASGTPDEVRIQVNVGDDLEIPTLTVDCLCGEEDVSVNPTWAHGRVPNTSRSGVYRGDYIPPSQTHLPSIKITVTVVGEGPDECDENEAPNARFTYRQKDDFSVLVDASASNDPDNELSELTFDWSWNGGMGHGLVLLIEFLRSGEYPVTLDVTDPCGATSSKTIQVVVEDEPDECDGDRPPELDFTYDVEGMTVHFDASGSYDPDGDPIVYTWTFGDGGIGSGIRPSHRYSIGGMYSVTLTGETTCAVRTLTKQVTVTEPDPCQDNQDPVSSFVYHVDGMTVHFDASGSYDPDGDPLSHGWNFDDGTTSDEGPLVTHTYTDPGTYRVGHGVEDACGNSDISHETVYVHGGNEPPYAEGAYVGVVYGDYYTMQIIVLSGDPDGDPIELVEESVWSTHGEVGPNPNQPDGWWWNYGLAGYPAGTEFSTYFRVTDGDLQSNEGRWWAEKGQLQPRQYCPEIPQTRRVSMPLADGRSATVEVRGCFEPTLR